MKTNYLFSEPPITHRIANSASLDSWVEALPPNLLHLLREELRAGNRILFEAGCGLEPETQVLILLERPFLHAPAFLPPDVELRERDAGDDWAHEYASTDGAFVLACPPVSRAAQR